MVGGPGPMTAEGASLAAAAASIDADGVFCARLTGTLQAEVPGGVREDALRAIVSPVFLD